MQKQPRKIILFDIDHTLFDATLYRKLMFDFIANYIDFADREKLNEALEATYISHRKNIGYFDLEIMLDELAKELHIDLNSRALFEAVLIDEASYEHAIFEETIAVLQEISKQKDIHIGIFSGGREEHQKKKIESFKHYFQEEHIHILKMKERDLSQIIAQYKHDQLYLVDDILQILYNAKQVHPAMTTIWMKRGHVAEQKQTIAGFTPDYTVENLKEVIPILKRGKEKA